MPETLAIPDCIDVPKKRWQWHWKAFERARYPSYQRNRSLFGRMLNQIYDVYVDGFVQGSTYNVGIRRAEQRFRDEAPEIIESTYITAYQNTAQEFARGFEQNHQKQLFDLLVGDEPEEPTEEDEDQDVATLALLAVRDFFTAAFFASQQRDLQAHATAISRTHSAIAKDIIQQETLKILGQKPGEAVPAGEDEIDALGEAQREALASQLSSVEDINEVARRARFVLRTQITPRHSNYFSVTETVAASNLGTLAVARARQRVTGRQLSKFWLSQRDNRVRDTHVQADGDRLPLGGFFNVGGSLLAFPGDWTHGAQLREIINCRCVLIYFSEN